MPWSDSGTSSVNANVVPDLTATLSPVVGTTVGVPTFSPLALYATAMKLTSYVVPDMRVATTSNFTVTALSAVPTAAATNSATFAGRTFAYSSATVTVLLASTSLSVFVYGASPVDQAVIAASTSV